MNAFSKSWPHYFNNAWAPTESQEARLPARITGIEQVEQDLTVKIGDGQRDRTT